MMQGVKSFIDEHVKLFQFAAVIITIGLGSHTIIQKFSGPTPQEQLAVLLKGALCYETVIVPGTTVSGRRTCKSPIEFDGVTVSDALPGGKAIVRTRFKRNRKNCPFVSWAPIILGSTGVQYSVEHSLNKNLTAPNPESPDQLTDVYQISIPLGVPTGPAEYRASIDYSCPDSVLAKEIVYYPVGLKFCILSTDGTRPKSCDE